tara:strand:- start:386 stop:547 length:162 start_codon:yes stop_codon:yes gene_type:complete
VTQPLDPDLLPLDRDMQHRLAMKLGSQMLLDRLSLFHPRIVRLLQAKNLRDPD